MKNISVKEIETLGLCKGSVPYDGIYCNDDNHWQWFKVKNENEHKSLLAAYGKSSSDMEMLEYPEWICVTEEGSISIDTEEIENETAVEACDFSVISLTRAKEAFQEMLRALYKGGKDNNGI